MRAEDEVAPRQAWDRLADSYSLPGNPINHALWAHPASAFASQAAANEFVPPARVPGSTPSQEDLLQRIRLSLSQENERRHPGYKGTGALGEQEEVAKWNATQGRPPTDDVASAMWHSYMNMVNALCSSWHAYQPQQPRSCGDTTDTDDFVPPPSKRAACDPGNFRASDFEDAHDGSPSEDLTASDHALTARERRVKARDAVRPPPVIRARSTPNPAQDEREALPSLGGTATPSTPTVAHDTPATVGTPADPSASLRSPRHQRKRKNHAVTSTLPGSPHSPGAKPALLAGAHGALGAAHGGPAEDAGPKQCKNCGTESTPFWRKDKSDGKPLCNACGLYLAKNDTHRPRALW